MNTQEILPLSATKLGFLIWRLQNEPQLSALERQLQVDTEAHISSSNQHLSTQLEFHYELNFKALEAIIVDGKRRHEVQIANAVRFPEGSAKKEGVESLIWNASRQKLNLINLKLVAISNNSYILRARTLL